MSHSREPDGKDVSDRSGEPDRTDAAPTGQPPGQPSEPPAGQQPVGPYQRPSFDTGGADRAQFPIPPQAWDEPDRGTPNDADDEAATAAPGAVPSRGVTSGAPLPSGPFFPPVVTQPAPQAEQTPDDAGAPFANWEPPPRVDWRPEPPRRGRRRRDRDAAAQQPSLPPQAAPPPAYQQAPPPVGQPYPAPPQEHAPQEYPAQPQPGQPPQQQPSWANQPPPQHSPAQQGPAQQSPAQQSPAQQPEPQFARTPRPEDLLAPNVRPTDAEPASWGWRGRVSRGSGGLIKPKASAEELAVRGAIERIQYGFSRPMTVVVVQPKGGAGKTPTTICLASAFGAYRGGYVVGWDDNETRGTLAVRVTNSSSQTSTVWDLLGDLDAFERFDARVGDLGHYVRAQPDAHFDALVSDDHPGNMSQIGEDEFHRLHRVLGRFYRMIVVDTGNNVRSPNWQAAVNAADLVVVVSSYQRDVGYSGSWVLDHLAQTGREELARNAVTVLTAADPTTDKAVRGQLLEHFNSRTRAVAEIPYDPALAHGGPIRWTELAEPTRNAWTLAAATVVDALAEQDRATRR